MSYEQLLNILKKLSNEQLQQTVTVYNDSNDEYLPVIDHGFTEVDDVLDKGHLYLSVDQ